MRLCCWLWLGRFLALEREDGGMAGGESPLSLPRVGQSCPSHPCSGLTPLLHREWCISDVPVGKSSRGQQDPLDRPRAGSASWAERNSANPLLGCRGFAGFICGLSMRDRFWPRFRDLAWPGPCLSPCSSSSRSALDDKDEGH